MSVLYYFRAKELIKIGYVLDHRVNWWFSEMHSIAVNDETIRQDYSKFKNDELIGRQMFGWMFYSYKQSNIDILETVYKIHFNQAKIDKLLPGV